METAAEFNLCRELVAKSTKVFIKKLSKNDCSWADDPSKHQSGFFIPSLIMKSDFFPELENKNPIKPHIFEQSIPSFWPTIGESKQSNLKHYSNKGGEVHFTGVPKQEFSALSPASFLVCGKYQSDGPDGAKYWFVTIDSMSESAELLESIMEFPYSFSVELYDPKDIKFTMDLTEELIREIENSIHQDRFQYLLQSTQYLPDSNEFAIKAQREYLLKNKLTSLSFRNMENPGDALMAISRDIEYELFRKYELRQRAMQVINLFLGKEKNIISAVVKNFSELDAIFLSASQVRKSRAGRSFEIHIARFLMDSRIKFEEQRVVSSRRPDFVLPNTRAISKTSTENNIAMILSAKTTLRERWKQITSEKFDCPIFLATVDDRVSESVINDMESENIILVVPETLKSAEYARYKNQKHVISFKEFFQDEIEKKRPALIQI